MRNAQWECVALFEDTSEAILRRTHNQGELGQSRFGPKWIGSDRDISIAGHRIPKAMLYVGPIVRHDAGVCNEAYCVDPTLLVATSAPDFKGELMALWPSYADLHPRARLAFLEWNADGRRMPDVHPGYILLFLYGLERRLVLEQGMEDARDILAELERLTTIYRPHSSVRKVVKKLIDIAELLLTNGVTVDTMGWGELDDGVPLSLKLSIGRAISNGTPVTADWVLLWVACDQERSFNLPSQLRLDEFAREFRTYLARVRPQGLIFHNDASRQLRYTYHSASNCFSVPLDDQIEGTPDIEAMPLVQLEVRALVCNALEEFTRQHWRSLPVVPSEMPVSKVLAPEAQLETGRKAVQQWARDRLAIEATISIRAALRRYRGMWPSRLERSEIVRLADVLGEANLGIVPDPRFDIEPARMANDAVLFELPLSSPPITTASADYRNALLMTMVCMSVARSDGHMSPEELQFIDRLVGCFENLQVPERSRLRAERQWMQLTPLPLEPIFREIRKLDDSERRRMAGIVVATAQADCITPEPEIVFSEALFAALGLPKAELHRALAIGSQVGSAQVNVNDPEPSQLNSLTVAGSYSSKPVDADDTEDLVSALFAESRVHQVSTEEDAEHPQIVRADQPYIAVSDDDLNGQHLAMLTALLRSPSWRPTELEQLARSHRLFADGAIEAINEWGFDEFEDRIFEFGENGSLSVNPNIDLQKLKRVA